MERFWFYPCANNSYQTKGPMRDTVRTKNRVVYQGAGVVDQPARELGN
ncbi:hypothetical protein NJB1907f44_29740 [Mycobacterium marinum]|nr:hypothetical protein NJB1907E90_35960 [Mycobacterium marinum]GJO21670.1 hypothetical protein NJB1907E11_30910 [Mycobacterium marinum]GJO32159.1 hypothetical protein NJB1907f22_32030 [Mycobacterium marinum]GJO42606.1 hypothetical protein NJB1907E19_32130 [Mycobacterium marinum]GJO53839.1 hypothetical protein NJB1907f3_35400 [Mycobacterium marinum]